MVDNKVITVLGSSYGDEGKGKVVDLLSKDVDIVARCQGGANAGHTIVVGNQTFKLHLIPSGILHEDVVCVIGNGVVINLEGIIKELETLQSQGIDYKDRLLISDKAHIVFQHHISIDERTGGRLGTTKRGIGPTLADKASRTGFRMGDLLDFDDFSIRFREHVLQTQLEIIPNRLSTYPMGVLMKHIDSELLLIKSAFDKIQNCVVDTISYLHNALESGKRVLVEGANALMLDIDFGTYPFVTSSNCSIGGVLTGLGIPPKYIGITNGVVKSYLTRVGTGPMPTELHDEIGEKLLTTGHEYGTTTGRPRRCGWMDLVMLRYSTRINGYTELTLTKLDTLSTFSEIKVCTSYFEEVTTADTKFITTQHFTLPSQTEANSELIPEYRTRY